MPDYIMAKVYDFLLFPLVYPVRRAILRIVKKNRYKKLLDVCCGTGNQLKYLHTAGYSETIIGMDISRPMLNVARKGLFSGNCFLGDAEQMPFCGADFDMTMISFALHEKKRPSAVAIFKEMIRVTKEKGHIILVDFSLGPSVPFVVRQLIRFLEFMAGKDHFGCFKQYCNTGGLDALCGDVPLTEIERQTIFFKAFTLRVFEK